eukprot:scaffold494_cov117-Isochrysis_galbana.AAC.10
MVHAGRRPTSCLRFAQNAPRSPPPVPNPVAQGQSRPPWPANAVGLAVGRAGGGGRTFSRDRVMARGHMARAGVAAKKGGPRASIAHASSRNCTRRLWA